MVTTDVLEARIAEAEVDPDLEGEAKTKLVALYRDLVSIRRDLPDNTVRVFVIATAGNQDGEAQDSQLLFHALAPLTLSGR